MAEKKTKEKGSSLELIFDIVSILATACVSVTLVFMFVFRTVGVVGDSMNPTLNTGDRIILTATYGESTNGDIVVTCQPSKSILIPDVLVKRVIAVAGQTVDIDFSTHKVYYAGKAILMDTFPNKNRR